MHDRARAAVLEVADDAAHVGPFLDVEPVGDVTVVRFASLHPGYPGWHWSVAVVGDASDATINEIWMEPGDGALRVPAWQPWSERLRPGDLGAGDVVETAPDDPRLEPGYAAATDGLDLPPQWEIGLGRERVLSAEGLAEAVERWHDGDHGPDAQMARLAEFPCSTCGWLLPVGGLVGQAFGVCAQALSPSDGHIVALDHGCGAHSAVRVEAAPVPVTELLVDETEVEPIDRASLAAVEAVASADDMADADEPEGQAGPGDVTPPEDALTLEGAAEDRGEDGGDAPDGGADDGGTNAVDVELP